MSQISQEVFFERVDNMRCINENQLVSPRIVEEVALAVEGMIENIAIGTLEVVPPISDQELEEIKEDASAIASIAIEIA